MKILVINGPNMNLLGQREVSVYGKDTYRDLCRLIRSHAKKEGVRVTLFQSNHEGAIIDRIQKAYGHYDGIIINPAAYTHTGIAIADAIKAVDLPTVEVHISNLARREEYRQISYVREACVATVMGHGFAGYTEAMDLLIERFV